MKKILHITLALGLLFSLSGCDFLEFLSGELEEADLGVNFDSETGEVSFNLGGDDEETTESASDLPKGWDSAIVLYEGADVTESYTNLSRENTSAHLTILVDDEMSTVRNFYRGVLSAGGYSISDESTNLEIIATKDEQTFTLSLALKGEQTQAKMVLEY